MAKDVFCILGLCLFMGCVSTPIKQEGNPLTEKAKWYFYAYASTLEGYSMNSGRVDPLRCEVVAKVRFAASDSVIVSCRIFYKDTSNYCLLKPTELVAITIKRDSIYLPIYNHIVFDVRPDSIELSEMRRQVDTLVKRLSIEKNISPWLLKNREKFTRDL